MKSEEKKRGALQESMDTAAEMAEASFSGVAEKLKEKESEIRFLESRTLELEEKLEEVGEASGSGLQDEGWSYSSTTRLLVYDAIINNVATSNMPHLIKKFSNRLDAPLERIPSRSSIENMVLEMGVISGLQTAETIHDVEDVTMGFDATTQEGVHVNSVHVTLKVSPGCMVIALDRLPGGTAQDYHDHVVSYIDHLADVYQSFHGGQFQECRQRVIDHVANSMTDRAAANHAAIRLINESWGKTLNELNCHLHPLDTIASSCRSALNKSEKNRGVDKGKMNFFTSTPE